MCACVGRAGLISKNLVFSECNDVFQLTQLSPSSPMRFIILFVCCKNSKYETKWSEMECEKMLYFERESRLCFKNNVLMHFVRRCAAWRLFLQ